MAMHPENWADILEAHIGMDPHTFALRQESYRHLAEQLDCYQRAAKKFPTLHKKGMRYQKTALEQSTSEGVLRWKQDEWKKYNGIRAADLTGGLGMDTAALAGAFEEVHYVEKNEALTELARNNHRVMGIGHIVHHTAAAENWIEKPENRQRAPFDLIYADPARREGITRVIKPEDSEPDMPELVPRLWDICSRVVVKLSPMLDLDVIKRRFQGLECISVISVDGEVKEIMAELRKDFMGWVTHRAVGLDRRGIVRFDVSEPERTLKKEPASLIELNTCAVIAELYSDAAPGSVWMALPDAAITKAGLARTVNERSGLNPVFLEPDGLAALYPAKPQHYPGRIFTVRDVLPWKPRELRNRLRDSRIRGVQVITRGIPLKPDAVLRALGVKPADDALIGVFQLGKTPEK